MILPIKYRTYNKKLFAVAGEEQEWKVIRQYGNSPKVITPISQNYGDDFIWTDANPVAWRGRYLYKDILDLPKRHNGIDLTTGGESGVCLYAPHDGKITELMTKDGLGIRLQGEKYQSIFFHLQKFLVSINQEVKQGDLIALTDNTGTASTAPHLHWGVRPANWKDNGDKMRGYFDFRDLIEDLDIYLLEEKEGMWLQHLGTGAVYEYRNGLLYHLNDKAVYDKNGNKHYELIDAVLRKMKKGIEPNSLRGMTEQEFNKYKNLVYGYQGL